MQFLFDPKNGHVLEAMCVALAALGNGRTARSEARTERPDAEAANSSFFDAKPDHGFFHQRRCSTADESGLPD